MLNIQDDRTIYNQVESPAAVFDADTGTLLKIGESDIIFNYYEDLQQVYRDKGFPKLMADALVFVDLPKDQELIDQIFQCSGFIKTWYEQSLTP